MRLREHCEAMDLRRSKVRTVHLGRGEGGGRGGFFDHLMHAILHLPYQVGARRRVESVGIRKQRRRFLPGESDRTQLTRVRAVVFARPGKMNQPQRPRGLAQRHR